MKKYEITIEEIISQTFEVYAENDEKAQEIAERKYKDGEFVLSCGNLIAKQMEIHNIRLKNPYIGFKNQLF